MNALRVKAADGKLHLGHDQGTKDALVAKLQWISQEEMKQKHLIVEWDKYRLLCQNQKQEFEKVLYDFALLGSVSDGNLSALRESAMSSASLLLTEQQELGNKFATFKPLNTELNVKLTNLSRLSDSVVKDLPTVEHLTPIVTLLEQNINSLRTETTNLYTDYQRAVENNSRVEQIKTLRFSYEKSFEYCRTLKIDLDFAHNEVQKATLEVGAINNLKKMSDEAVLSAVGSVVNSINSHLKQYVDIVFPEGGTQIYLMNESFTKKDERRAKMGLKVIHRGLEMSLDDFSGGAENRATLATQLAISDLFGSPILMLDEALTGSHPDLRDSIIDHLRTVGQSKLVLVVEHGVSDSLFDDVIINALFTSSICCSPFYSCSCHRCLCCSRGIGVLLWTLLPSGVSCTIECKI